MWEKIANVFTGGAFKSIENIATEWIDTEKETAEAKALMVKTLDPNGLMRRDQSSKILGLYIFYMLVMCLLIGCEFFNFVPEGATIDSMAKATDKLVDLFVPITAMVSLIVSASFGVNYHNVKMGK
jgi:hypothetical protein